MKMIKFLFLAMLPLAGLLAHAAKQPNIVIIMADDMGFSDIGPYGGEISTPNLERLASSGVRFSQMYNFARCCPSRAALLTGIYPHQAGVGHMNNEMPGIPGYQGYLNESCVTVAEVLRTRGYRTHIPGKWHVGDVRGDPDLPPEMCRGFDRLFGMGLAGGVYYPLDCHVNPVTFLSAMKNHLKEFRAGDDVRCISRCWF